MADGTPLNTAEPAQDPGINPALWQPEVSVPCALAIAANHSYICSAASCPHLHAGPQSQLLGFCAALIMCMGQSLKAFTGMHYCWRGEGSLCWHAAG